MGRASNAVLVSSLFKAILNRPEYHLIGMAEIVSMTLSRPSSV
jgi:hypothetical protein